jgi:hypothetical protein
MSNLGRMGVRDCFDVTIFDLTTLKPVLYLESLKVSSTTVGAETVYARGGRGNPRRLAWDGTKDVDFKGTDCLISPEAFSILLGSTLENGSQYLAKTQVIEVTGTSATLAATPYVSDLTNYPVTVNLNTNNDGSTIGTELTKVSGTPSAGEYSLSGGVLTFGDTYSADNIIVTYYYTGSVNTKRITITSDEFPKTFKIHGYCLYRDEKTGDDYPAVLTIPKAKLLTPFEIKQEVSGDPSTFDFNFTCLKPVGNTEMYTLDIETDNPI